MKTWIIAPMAMLLASVAVAQTSGSNDAGSGNSTGSDQPAGSGAYPAGSGPYGSNWSSEAGTAFMSSDGGTMTMRSDADLATGWSSLSQTDRDMILADCTQFQSDVAAGTVATDGTGTVTSGEGTAGAGSSAAVTSEEPVLNLSVADMTRLCNNVMGM